MDSNDLWQDQVNGLTRQVAYTLQKVEELNQRMTYYEEVIIALISALKKGGVIVDDDDGPYSMPT